MGVDNATSWSTQALRLVTDLGGHVSVLVALVVVALAEYRRVPNRRVPIFLVVVVAGEITLVNTIKGILDRVRPTFNPIAETSGRRSRAATPAWRRLSTRLPRW